MIGRFFIPKHMCIFGCIPYRYTVSLIRLITKMSNNNNNNNNNNNTTLSTVMGTIGLVFWSFQLAPQVYKNYKSKSTFGLSSAMMLIWALSAIFFGIYAIALDLPVPLQVQPQLFGFIALICWAQCLYYGNSWSKSASIVTFTTACFLTAGVQLGFVFAVRFARTKDAHWAIVLAGVVPVVLIFLGFVPQYLEIWRSRKVQGISLIFLAVDILGAFFSVLSLAFASLPFDYLAALNYIGVFVLDSLIVLLYFILGRTKENKEGKDLE